MANPARGEVTLDLGEARYVLAPTFGAVCAIEERIGTSLFDIGRRLERAEITARELVEFAHACVVENGHEIEPTRLGELIVAAGTHATVRTLVAFCRNYAFGGEEEKKAAAPADGASATAARSCAPT